MKKSFVASLLRLVLQCAVARERLSLNSYDGQQWQLFSSAIAAAADIRIAKDTWQPESYINGIVPGTVFSAYVAAGEEDDPNFGDNIYRVNESKYNVAHWYRTSFDRLASATDGSRTILTFEGVNRSAIVYFNGKRIGYIKGHVMKVRYDVTDLMLDKGNFLAVKILMMKDEWLPRTSNFVNYCCPTYVPSHSWDWMPYVPGLNTGITNDVYIETFGEVTVRDPWVRTKLSRNNTRATLSASTSLVNLTAEESTVSVKATIQPGNYSVTKEITIAAGDSIDVKMPDVTVENPLLWWPNGYGEQNLYLCDFEVTRNGKIIDSY